MMVGVSPSPFSQIPQTIKTTTHFRHYFPISTLPSNSNLETLKKFNKRSAVQRNSSSSNGGRPGPSSGENDSEVVLDAFFLGKAFAEALNERIGSTVGEILSVLGQWQAEQQKQVQDFQEEVLGRAKRAKEKAALEAMESRGLIPKSLPKPPTSTMPITPSSSSGPSTNDPLQETQED